MDAERINPRTIIIIVFGQKKFTSMDTIRKGISKGAECMIV